VLVRIANPEQIAAISHYSHDPRATSIVPLARALRFPVTSGTAEEVIAKQADLVIAGPHVALPTIHALQKLGIPLMQMGVPQSIADSQKEISRLAAAIGQSARGKRLNATIDAALDRAEPHDKALVPALIWQGGGMVPGADTLADELLRRTGFANMSSAYGLQQWDVLPIEHLLARPPRVLLSVGAEGQRDRMLSHPVMRHLAEHIAIRAYSPRLLHCGGPTIIDAVDRLSQIRRSLKDKTR
jgi:iron complex transport system substrate-binding protein